VNEDGYLVDENGVATEHHVGPSFSTYEQNGGVEGYLDNVETNQGAANTTA
jgi:hypothetical protein